ncbi:aspartate aminotransferase family protein [Paludibaculum fermentans]|uniref:Aspartate aminotransferase family protein n=1 Tax=Paludibaculum fermentans TaxID=1473598 RepID=A0A7S7SHJ1_PALFE|nr:aspartate aminotransferase family protein [Paludibaculum fermentans]QOY85972.1 aspartate aminotransferase family protein [Paludibaculum fermentans]
MSDPSFTPRPVPAVETQFRRIHTQFPVPESLPILQKLHDFELRAMAGQPPVVWDRAEGFQVYDAWGNKWLDWSSGVLITNAGHGRKEIADAISAQAQHTLLTNYCFPSAIRAELCERLVGLMPEPLKKIFLLTTGSETVEFAVKIARIHGHKIGGRSKNVIVSFEKAFHGRTMGSQQVGGIPVLKEWIGNLDPGFVQVPFPDGYWTEDTSFELFERTLAENGVAPSQVCAVILETYQGGTAAFAPPQYIKTLRQWCDGHRALLVFDEVQAGFGRTGTLWGFEHYGVLPDLTTWGKGISSSLPISAIVGKPELMDLPNPGSASSTHTGNPVCCAAALANVDLIVKENLPHNAAVVGEVLQEGLRKIKARFPQAAYLAGKGLVAGLACVKAHKQPDGELAHAIVWRCVEKGLLMFSPVGPAGCTIKIAPPLNITAEAVREGCAVLEEAFEEVLAERAATTPDAVAQA